MESSGGSKAKSTRMSEVTVVLYSLFSDYDDHDAVSLPRVWHGQYSPGYPPGTHPWAYYGPGNVGTGTQRYTARVGHGHRCLLGGWPVGAHHVIVSNSTIAVVVMISMSHSHN